MVGDYMVGAADRLGPRGVLERDPLAALRRLADAGARASTLLLTDQTMPGMTGLAAGARRAAACGPALPVLLYTGNAAEIDAEELRRPRRARAAAQADRRRRAARAAAAAGCGERPPRQPV